MNPLKLAVVGVGALGRHHARILGGLESADLVGVAEMNLEAGRAVASACGCDHVTDFHELLDRVDAVTIAVPTSAHLAVAGDCLAAGLPVMIEKPIAGSLDDAARLVELADRHDALLQVGHVERFNPAVTAAFERIDRPRYLRAERFSPFAFRSMDIGVVHDLMIHDLDLVLALVNSPLEEVSAFGIGLMGGHEDMVNARLRFANGCIADLIASRVHPEPRRSLVAWSASGCVQVDLHSRELTSYCPSEALLLGKSPTQQANEPGADIEELKQQVFGEFIQVDTPDISDADALTAELEHFIDCVTTGKPPLVGGLEAIRAMAAADQVLSSVATHQWEGRPNGAQGPLACRPQRRAA
ncbi:MAG: oxidoreductase [Planctomycetaceae bacterium]|jgi:predicted dehydrogenase|nr:oxidoreductase [Planctomycetaceae bacterium]